MAIDVTRVAGVTGHALMQRRVAVLFAREDSNYKAMPGCNVYDAQRDARSWPGGEPCIAHPPCRGWGRLRGMANPDPGEEANAVWAVRQVRTWGGVLEHPSLSTLWKCCKMAEPGQRDQWGGWCHPIMQSWFGHKAEKGTWLYIVGAEPDELPGTPLSLEWPTHTVSTNSKYKRLPELSKALREHTPPTLAAWLVEVARRTRQKPRPVW